jgi:hypothetical protein
MYILNNNRMIKNKLDDYLTHVDPKLYTKCSSPPMFYVFVTCTLKSS